MQIPLCTGGGAQFFFSKGDQTFSASASPGENGKLMLSEVVRDVLIHKAPLCSPDKFLLFRSQRIRLSLKTIYFLRGNGHAD